MFRRFLKLCCVAGLLLGPLGIGRALHESARLHGAEAHACHAHDAAGSSHSRTPASEEPDHHDGCSVCLAILTASAGTQAFPPIVIERSSASCGSVRVPTVSLSIAAVDLVSAGPRAPPVC